MQDHKLKALPHTRFNTKLIADQHVRACAHTGNAGVRFHDLVSGNGFLHVTLSQVWCYTPGGSGI